MLHEVAVSPVFAGVNVVIAVPTVPEIVDGEQLIMGISAAPIVIVTVAVSLPVVLLAVTMNAVDDIVVVGVPLKRPVVVEKVIPLGSDGGASIDQLLMTPPVLVGIKVEIAEFTFPDNAPDEGYEISGAKSPEEVTTVI